MGKAKGLPKADASQDAGSPPTADRGESLEALTAQPDGVADPGDRSPIPVGLAQAAVELQALRTTAPLDRLRLQRLRLRSVVAGEVLRLGQEPLAGVAGPLTAGHHVAALEPGLFRALRYGYLSLQDDRLSVLSPVLVDQDRMAAYWLLLDPERRPVDLEMILRCLAGARVIEGVLGKAIERLVEEVTQGTHRCQAVLVASGRPPRDGQHALVQALVPVVSSPENGTHPEPVPVHEKQVLARLRVATAGEGGMDVSGTVLPTSNGRDQELRAGENVLVERAGNLLIYRAATAGVARLDGEVLSVARLLSVAGSVGFGTGNLDFDGHVQIEGSVVRGFTVQASHGVHVGGAVEAGAQVRTRGDVRVGGGIVGNRTRVAAGGLVTARFVEDATVTAAGDIVLTDFASRAVLVAGGQVRVTRRPDDDRTGSVAGGQVWARQGLVVHTAGTGSATPTLLVVGLVRDQAEKLDRMTEGLQAAYGQLTRYLERFGLSRLDQEQIRNLIDAATGPRRKLLQATAERLGRVVHLYKVLSTSRRHLKEQIEAVVGSVQLEIQGRAYPGVEVRIGELRQTLANGGPYSFRIVDGKLVNLCPPPPKEDPLVQ